MSVIVTGMKMPQNCETCKYNQCEYHGREWFSKKTNENYSWCRADDCPLKSIDGLIEKIKNTKAGRCIDNLGNVFVLEEDLYKIIKEYYGMEDAE